MSSDDEMATRRELQGEHHHGVFLIIDAEGFDSAAGGSRGE